MTLNRKIDALKRLTHVYKELNAKTLDRSVKVTDLSFFERSSKLFEPLIESNVKVNDNLRELEKGIKQQNMFVRRASGATLSPGNRKQEQNSRG